MISNFCYQLMLSIKTSLNSENRRYSMHTRDASINPNTSSFYPTCPGHAYNSRGFHQKGKLNNQPCGKSVSVSEMGEYAHINSNFAENCVRNQSKLKDMCDQMKNTEILNNRPESRECYFLHSKFKKRSMPFKLTEGVMFQSDYCMDCDRVIKPKKRDEEFLLVPYYQNDMYNVPICEPLCFDVPSKYTQSTTPKISSVSAEPCNGISQVPRTKKTFFGCSHFICLKKNKLAKEERKFVKFKKKHRAILEKTKTFTQESEIKKNIQYYEKKNEEIMRYMKAENMPSFGRTRENSIREEYMKKICNKSTFSKIRKLHKQTLKNIKKCDEAISEIKSLQLEAEKYESGKNINEIEFYSISLLEKSRKYKDFREKYQNLIHLLTRIIRKVEAYKSKII